MKRFLLAFAIQFVVSLLAFGQKPGGQTRIPEFFLTRPNETTIQIGPSFAHWFVAQHFSSSSEAELRFTEINLSLDEMMKKSGYTGPSQFDDFAARMFYYHEQTARFREPFESYLRSKASTIHDFWNQKMAREHHPFWISYTDQEGEILLCGRNQAAQKMRIRLQSANLNAITIENGPLLKSSGKGKKAYIGTTTLEQRIRFSASESIRFQVRWKGSPEYFFSYQPAAPRPPAIHRFATSESVIDEGEMIHLNWDVSGASEVQIEPGIGSQAPRWQISTAPSTTTTYTLKALNNSGEVSAQTSVEVNRIYLSRVEVTFLVPEKGDPKEATSQAIFELKNNQKQTISTILCGEGQKFPANGAYQGPFFREDFKGILKKDMIDGSFSISLKGSVADTWTFSPIVVLLYSDGTTKSLYGYATQTLTTDGKAFSVDF